MPADKLRRKATLRLMALPGCALAVAGILSACGGGGDSADSKDEVVLGFAISQSGDLAPFDQESADAAFLRIDQINAAGGINGKMIKTITKDARSNQDTVGIVATELISEGIDLMVTPCDFDMSAPAAVMAQGAGIPALSICAGDPKMADAKTLGDFIFSATAGSDVEGSAGAEWAFGNGWKTAYVLQDESVEYSKSAGRYFGAKYEALGGAIIGADSFPGGSDVNIASQAARLKGLSTQPDFVYVASWNPAAASAIRQLREAGVSLPVVGPAALDGKSLLDVVGDASDIYYTTFACYSYCEGTDSAPLDEFTAAYAAKYGEEPQSSYAVLGYNMVNAVAAAIERSPSLSGEDIRNELAAGVTVDTPVGSVSYFSNTCHKIIDYPMSIVNVRNGTIQYLTQQRVSIIPDLGDQNSCAG